MWKLKQRADAALSLSKPWTTSGRHDEERPGGKRVRAVAEVERELAVDDEERVRVLAVDVRRRSALAGAVVRTRRW